VSRAAGPGVKACAVLCYLIGLTGAAALCARVFLLGLDLFPPMRGLSGAWPWLIDLAWLAIFGIQHSGMARADWKRRLVALLPVRLERSIYAAASGLILVGLAVSWQLLPSEPIWHGPAWLIIIPLGAAAGMTWINLRFDHLGLLGIRQVWEAAPPEEQLLVLGPYRYVRHPLMACLLLMLWAQPVMTPTLAVLSGGMSAYIVVGLVFEERDLLRQFGPAYAAYRLQVPALVPWRRPVAPAVYPAVNQA
jgi:protein-S-isoprenylcysteine O-methyltransferase Ste14